MRFSVNVPSLGVNVVVAAKVITGDSCGAMIDVPQVATVTSPDSPSKLVKFP